MKIDLTKKQIEAIQKLLHAHSGAGGEVPKAIICWNAFVSIEKQTKIIHVTENDLEQKPKKELTE